MSSITNLDCSICIESFNRSTRKPIQCSYCSFECCASCCKRYLLDQITDPHCMNCKKEWNSEFMRTHFTKTFMDKEYRIHKENLLLEREKSLLPAAQEEIEKERLLHEKDLEIQKLYQQIRELHHEKEHIRTRSSRETRKFVRQCPMEECRGFLSSKWKCGTCATQFCSKCHELLNDPHTCDSGILENVKAMESETRPCPNCGIPIFKINGCDQMFCVECQTAFSWKTGSIETGVIHNPHYYEWSRSQNREIRNVNEIRCGGLVSLRMLRDIIIQLKCSPRTQESILETFHRSVGHVQQEIHYMTDIDFNPHQDLYLRVAYLKNTIDEEYWKKQLYKRHKKRTKNRSLRDIRATYVDVVSGLLRDFVSLSIPYEHCIEQCNSILDYCNEQIERLNRLYSCKLKYIDIEN